MGEVTHEELHEMIAQRNAAIAKLEAAESDADDYRGEAIAANERRDRAVREREAAESALRELVEAVWAADKEADPWDWLYREAEKARSILPPEGESKC